MQRRKKYPRVEFSATALQKIVSELKNIVEDPAKVSFSELMIERKTDSWTYDTFEEFIAELDNDVSWANFSVSHPELSIRFLMWPAGFAPTEVSISSSRRESILRLGNVVDSCADDCFVPAPPEPKKELPKPKIFIGHGASPQWRDLKDHLQERHGYEVVAYETGSPEGHTIRDVIAEVLDKSSFAILVMTGEDVMEDGTVRARQNVIHETGLFQGRLGFTRTIVLMEEGTEEFSNIHGVNQIRYTKGKIKETFGDVLAVLKREFGEAR
jgi:hypothetical protein